MDSIVFEKRMQGFYIMTPLWATVEVLKRDFHSDIKKVETDKDRQSIFQSADWNKYQGVILYIKRMKMEEGINKKKTKLSKYEYGNKACAIASLDLHNCLWKLSVPCHNTKSH